MEGVGQNIFPHQRRQLPRLLYGGIQEHFSSEGTIFMGLAWPARAPQPWGLDGQLLGSLLIQGSIFKKLILLGE